MITAPIEIVGTDADDTKWVSLDDVKDELGITVATYDAILTKRIQRASARLLKFTNLRGVAFRRYRETLPAPGLANRIMVTRTPIVNFLELEHLDPQQLLERVVARENLVELRGESRRSFRKKLASSSTKKVKSRKRSKKKRSKSRSKPTAFATRTSTSPRSSPRFARERTGSTSTRCKRNTRVATST